MPMNTKRAGNPRADAEALSTSSAGDPADENRPLPGHVSKKPALIRTRVRPESFSIGPTDPFNLGPVEYGEVISDSLGSSSAAESREEEDGKALGVTDEDELLSVGSHSVTVLTDNSDQGSGLASSSELVSDAELNLSDMDDDERYARLLQQQEFALARHHHGSYYDSELEAQLLESPTQQATDIDMSYEALLVLEENLGEVKKRGLEESSVQALPSFSFSSRLAARSEAEAIFCPICMHEYQDEQSLIQLPCSHVFHAECGADWLRVRASCPICRKIVSESP